MEGIGGAEGGETMVSKIKILIKKESRRLSSLGRLAAVEGNKSSLGVEDEYD